MKIAPNTRTAQWLSNKIKSIRLIQRDASTPKKLTTSTLATPPAWYKCLNSQNGQTCLSSARKVFSGLQSESPKAASCKVLNPVLGCFPPVQNRVCAVPETLLVPRDAKSLLALLRHFWGFWLFWHLYQASRVANQHSTTEQQHWENATGPGCWGGSQLMVFPRSWPLAGQRRPRAGTTARTPLLARGCSRPPSWPPWTSLERERGVRGLG